MHACLCNRCSGNHENELCYTAKQLIPQTVQSRQAENNKGAFWWGVTLRNSEIWSSEWEDSFTWYRKITASITLKFQADAQLLYKRETAARVAQQLCFTSSAETEGADTSVFSQVKHQTRAKASNLRCCLHTGYGWNQHSSTDSPRSDRRIKNIDPGDRRGEFWIFNSTNINIKEWRRAAGE